MIKPTLGLLLKNAERVGEVFSIKERKPRAKETKPRERKALGKGVAVEPKEAA